VVRIELRVDLTDRAAAGVISHQRRGVVVGLVERFQVGELGSSRTHAIRVRSTLPGVEGLGRIFGSVIAVIETGLIYSPSLDAQ
jgi:hypothetical protein